MTRLQQYVKQYLSIPSWNQERRKFYIWQWLQEIDKECCDNHIKFLDSLRVYKCKIVLTAVFEYDRKLVFTFYNLPTGAVCEYPDEFLVARRFTDRALTWLNEEAPDV